MRLRQACFVAAMIGATSCSSGRLAPFPPFGSAIPATGGFIERDLASSMVDGYTRVFAARDDDTLVELARRNGLGFIEVLAANPGIDPWMPGEGTTIVLPSAHLVPTGPREGIVINLADQRLYLFEPGGGNRVMSFPIGVSRTGWKTPLGTTRVVRKRERPTWVPPASARREDPKLPKAVPPGADNPLGTHALYLDWPRYLIHGTNEPYGVGRRVSRGCIRLYPEDIVRLYEFVPVGTPVRVIHDPIKLAMVRGEIFVEVHPTLAQAGTLQETGRFSPRPASGLRKRLEAFVTELVADERFGPEIAIDWALVEKMGQERRGVPVRVSL